jgi:hypothetical protein
MAVRPTLRITLLIGRQAGKTYATLRLRPFG